MIGGLTARRDRRLSFRIGDHPCGLVACHCIVECMVLEDITLQGSYVRLEPLDHRHIDGLVTAAAAERPLYQWSPVPQGATEATKYVETAISWKKAGTAMPFAIVRAGDGVIIGSTRFWNIEFWGWPAGHPNHGRTLPDACEIGYTWLAASSIRTGANTECKRLMLQHAFEHWKVLRVCLHTDARNQRSRKAIERIGGQFEGILRSHRMAADFTPRDSVRYSILASEWPQVKERLTHLAESQRGQSA